MMDITKLILLVGLSMAFWIIWGDYFKKMPLSYYGLDVVKKVIKYEPVEYQEMVLKRGLMTRREWVNLNEKQIKEITAELKRRGVE